MEVQIGRYRCLSSVKMSVLGIDPLRQASVSRCLRTSWTNRHTTSKSRLDLSRNMRWRIPRKSQCGSMFSVESEDVCDGRVLNLASRGLKTPNATSSLSSSNNTSRDYAGLNTIVNLGTRGYNSSGGQVLPRKSNGDPDLFTV